MLMQQKNANEQFGLKVHSSQLEQINYPDGYFDAINMNHVIEHVFDPVKLLLEWRRILKPTGCFVVITPNINSFGHSLFKRNWFNFDPPRHVFLFSELSLRLLAGKTDFNDCTIFTTSAIAEIVFRGSLCIRKVGKYDIKGISSPLNAFEKLKAVLMQAHETLRVKAEPGVGEEVVMISGSK